MTSKAPYKAKWDEWKADKDANAIFWNFVEAERNNLLKQYKFASSQSQPTSLLKREMGSSPKSDPIVTEDDFFRLSHVGCEDKERRDVVAEAIEWWRKQLDEIEAQVSL